MIAHLEAEESWAAAAKQRVVQFNGVGAVGRQLGAEPRVAPEGRHVGTPGQLHVTRVVKPDHRVEVRAEPPAFNFHGHLLPLLAGKRRGQHRAAFESSGQRDVQRRQISDKTDLRQIVDAQGNRFRDSAGRSGPQVIDARGRLSLQREFDFDAFGGGAGLDGVLFAGHRQPDLRLGQQLGPLDDQRRDAARLQSAQRQVADARRGVGSASRCRTTGRLPATRRRASGGTAWRCLSKFFGRARRGNARY